MSNLAQSQAEFQSHLVAGDDAVIPRITGDSKADARTRLEVYFQAYRLRLAEVLGNDFTGLRALLADEFDAMACAYLDAYPSTHPSVRWFGRHLAGFLRETPPWQERPALAEMAKFEWAWGQAFDAADADPVGDDELQRISPEDWGVLRIGFHPSVQVLVLNSNVPSLFAAATSDEVLPALDESGATPWLVWRHDLKVNWRSLDTIEHASMELMNTGGNFGALCEGLCEWHPADEVPLQAASLLKQWLVDGLVIELTAS